MKILYYQKPQNKSISTCGSHVYELLHNLTRLGHTIIYINGHIHTASDYKDAALKLTDSTRISIYGKIKVFLNRLPIKGEIALIWMLFKEIAFLLRSSILLIKDKPDVIYRRHSLFNFQHLFSLFGLLPTVEEVNGIISDEARINKTGSEFSLSIIRFIERCAFPPKGKYVVVTSRLKEILHSLYGVPEDNITVIENGANANLFRPMDYSLVNDQFGLNTDTYCICYAGSLASLQGVEYLIKALPIILDQYPSTKALIVGDGPMKDRLSELVAKLDISGSVIFTGRVRYEQVPMYINTGTVCVAPFVKERNERIGLSPVKLCEYLSCKKPVVASRISGLEVLEEYNCGYLVNPEDPEALAKAIIVLLNDPALRQRMGENGRKYVLKNRTWESVAREVSRVCETTIKEYKKQK